MESDFAITRPVLEMTNSVAEHGHQKQWRWQLEYLSKGDTMAVVVVVVWWQCKKTRTLIWTNVIRGCQSIKLDSFLIARHCTNIEAGGYSRGNCRCFVAIVIFILCFTTAKAMQRATGN